MKTAELTGAQLNWAVQQCEGQRTDIDFAWWTEDYTPSTNWAQGGPIIEREQIELRFTAVLDTWYAQPNDMDSVCQRKKGPTPLIAAMRCYVVSKLGDEVEMPSAVLESTDY